MEQERNTDKMYKYFELESQTNFKTKGTFPHFLNRLDQLSTKAKQIYTFLLEKLSINYSYKSCKTGIIKKQRGMYRVVEGGNVYIEVKRSTIANWFKMALGTVRKCIVELRQHGLLVDVRMGQGNTNRIFLKYPVDAEYIYNAESKEDISSDKKGQEKSDVESANSSSLDKSHKAGINNSVRDIISHLHPNCTGKNCKELMIIAKGTTDEEKLESIQRAAIYCTGREPRTTMWQMLCDALRNNYQAKQNEKKDSLPNKQSYPKKKKNVFTSIHSHDWDMEELEQLADRHMMSNIDTK